MPTPTADTVRLASLAGNLQNDLGVKESYRHTAKWVIPGDPIRLGSARDPRAGDGDPPSRTLTSDHARLQPHDLAHRRLQRRGRDSLGFVIDSRSPDRSVALPCDQCLHRRLRTAYPAPLRARLLLPHRQHLAWEQRSVGDRLPQGWRCDDRLRPLPAGGDAQGDLLRLGTRSCLTRERSVGAISQISTG
jgi:hypothetical protein